MEEDIRFGIGVTGLICSVGYVIGGFPAILACAAFCAIPWFFEIRERMRNEYLELETCQLCGSKFRIKNKTMEFEYRTVGLCPLCIDKIFQYSKSVPENHLER